MSLFFLSVLPFQYEVKADNEYGKTNNRANSGEYNNGFVYSLRPVM